MFQNIFKLNIYREKISFSHSLFLLLILGGTLELTFSAKHQPALAAEPSGRMAFVKAGCWGCHPAGDNAINGDKPLKGANFLKKYAADQALETAIRQGFPAKGMPPYGKSKVNEGEMKLIISYIRSLTPASK